MKRKELFCFSFEIEMKSEKKIEKQVKRRNWTKLLREEKREKWRKLCSGGEIKLNKM